MARLIVKSPYLKCGGSTSVSGYLRYIGTRERVELLPDDRPPTRKQEQLVRKLTKDFPEAKELGEYSDYEAKPTKANASAFITRALEENWPAVQQSDGYMKYIATRPRAERLGDHGLFSDEDGVELAKAMDELDHYTGNVWTHIISLKRGDAARLGYDNAKAWRDLLWANRNGIATAMHIPPNHFRWYAAFHNEGEHPHVHMMAWSTHPGEAHLTKDGIRKIKSVLTNQIFRHEMLHAYEQKSAARDELVREARKAMLELARQMRRGVCQQLEAERMLLNLSQQLENVHGKKSYGYLPKPIKKQVDAIVEQLEQIAVVDQCYQVWWDFQCQVNDYYRQQDRHRPPLSSQKEFRAIKNAVIREAERIRLREVTFEDTDLTGQDEPEQVQGASYVCWELRQVIRDNALPLETRDSAADALERLAKQDDLYAQYLMGLLYRDGPLLIPDSRRAKHWLIQSAERGLPEAQYALGKLLLSDDWEVREADEGIRWLKQAAQNGNHFAAYRLGKEYLKGGIVAKNPNMAVPFLRQAAEQDNPYAQYLLGKLYLTGEGVPRDRELARQWFHLAESGGHAYAGFAQMQMDHQVSPAVLLSATLLLQSLGTIFESRAPQNPVPGGIRIDRKRLQKLRELREARGLRGTEYDEGPYLGGMTMGW